MFWMCFVQVSCFFARLCDRCMFRLLTEREGGSAALILCSSSLPEELSGRQNEGHLVSRGGIRTTA
jgi:hypothetical protein